MQTHFVYQQLGWCQARLMEWYLYVAMCIRTVNLWFLSVRWYYTPSQSFRASVRSSTPIRKLCQKSSWQSPAECQEEGEGILFPSVVESGRRRKRVNVCDGACVSAGWSTRRKTTRGACTSYLRGIIQICPAWDVHPASPCAHLRLWQWWEIKHTNESLSCRQSVPWTSTCPPCRRSQFPPSHCSAWSVWRAERSPWRRRSPACWKKASTTTYCPSESTAAGETACFSTSVPGCWGNGVGNNLIWFSSSAVGWYLSTVTTGGASSSWSQSKSPTGWSSALCRLLVRCSQSDRFVLCTLPVCFGLVFTDCSKQKCAKTSHC